MSAVNTLFLVCIKHWLVVEITVHRVQYRVQPEFNQTCLLHVYYSFMTNWVFSVTGEFLCDVQHTLCTNMLQ